MKHLSVWQWSMRPCVCSSRSSLLDQNRVSGPAACGWSTQSYGTCSIAAHVPPSTQILNNKLILFLNVLQLNSVTKALRPSRTPDDSLGRSGQRAENDASNTREEDSELAQGACFPLVVTKNIYIWNIIYIYLYRYMIIYISILII